jgi:hypothetical protein
VRCPFWRVRVWPLVPLPSVILLLPLPSDHRLHGRAPGRRGNPLPRHMVRGGGVVSCVDDVVSLNPPPTLLPLFSPPPLCRPVLSKQPHPAAADAATAATACLCLAAKMHEVPLKLAVAVAAMTSRCAAPVTSGATSSSPPAPVDPGRAASLQHDVLSIWLFGKAATGPEGGGYSTAAPAPHPGSRLPDPSSSSSVLPLPSPPPSLPVAPLPTVSVETAILRPLALRHPFELIERFLLHIALSEGETGAEGSCSTAAAGPNSPHSNSPSSLAVALAPHAFRAACAAYCDARGFVVPLVVPARPGPGAELAAECDGGGDVLLAAACVYAAAVRVTGPAPGAEDDPARQAAWARVYRWLLSMPLVWSVGAGAEGGGAASLARLHNLSQLVASSLGEWEATAAGEREGGVAHE